MGEIMENLTFDHTELTKRGRGLTYDDVLLIPSKSEMRSRREPELKTRLTKNKSMDLPFISANMDTITEANMAIAMDQEGGFGIIHRFMSIADQVKEVGKSQSQWSQKHWGLHRGE
jgi:IMP dehydrogenase